MTLLGHNEQKDSYQGNLKKLINLLSKYDNTLNNHFEKISKKCIVDQLRYSK